MACTALLKDPNGSTEDLISYTYSNDMCECENCITVDEVKSIPAAVTNGKGQSEFFKAALVRYRKKDCLNGLVFVNETSCWIVITNNCSYFLVFRRKNRSRFSFGCANGCVSR